MKVDDMPLPAIGAAAARAGAAAGRAGAKAGQAAKKAAEKPKKPTIKEKGVAQKMTGINIGALFSVEAVMILITAGLIDILGLVDAIPILGTFMSYVFDIVGFLLIGGWLMFFRGKSPVFRRVTTLSLGTLGELIPALGMLPFWTGVVLIELLFGD